MQQESSIILTAKQRILYYLEYKGITQYQFSKETGLSNGFLKSGKTVTSDNLKLLSSIYPDLNLLWVITGDGDVAITSNEVKKSSIGENDQNQADENEKNFQQFDNPKLTTQTDNPKTDFDNPKRQPKIKQNSKYDTSTEKNFQENVSPKMSAQNVSPKQENVSPKCKPKTEIAAHDGAIQRNYHGATYVEAGGIPLIPIDAAAGILSGDNVQVMDYECDHYVIPAFHGADFLIRVAGNSMTPRYMSGDLVACIRLAMVDFLQWNKSYIIDSAQGVLLKRVKRSEKPDHLLLISENEEYDPFEIPTSEIRGLALVVGLIRIE